MCELFLNGMDIHRRNIELSMASNTAKKPVLTSGTNHFTAQYAEKRGGHASALKN